MEQSLVDLLLFLPENFEVTLSKDMGDLEIRTEYRGREGHFSYKRVFSHSEIAHMEGISIRDSFIRGCITDQIHRINICRGGK